MNATLCDAIRNRKVVRFYYDRGMRTVEPFCYGVSSAGNDVLRGYQTGGYSVGGYVPFWKLFQLDGISALSVDTESFTRARAHCSPGDSAMPQVYCCVENRPFRRDVHKTFFCPERKLRADMTISFDRSGPKARLGVVSCDLLRHGETCDLTCVGGNAQAQDC